MSASPVIADPAITEATAVGGHTLHIGDAVKHWGERWTGSATSRVVGFSGPSYGYSGTHVLVWPPSVGYGGCWAEDRTEVARAGHYPPVPTAEQACEQFALLGNAWSKDTAREVAEQWRAQDGPLTDMRRDATKAAIARLDQELGGRVPRACSKLSPAHSLTFT